MKKNRSLWIVLTSFVFVIAAVLIYNLSSSSAVILEDDVRVQEDSDLTYYLDINYDGKDKDVVMSSDTATADVRSGYIYVQDKIPDGLIFKSFVNTSDGSIGAVKRSDNSSCPGYVVGGYNGLTYNEADRTVSFKIKNLQAGCKVIVGIVTRTPVLPDNVKRMDFYNTAYANEGTFSAKSNTVHVWMGRENTALYSVKYEYSGTVPDNAPALPTASSHAAGNTVGVSSDLSLEGYTFSGWTSSQVTVNNGSFTMPANDITFVGSFTKNETKKVNYTISGDTPDGYIAPREKEYAINTDVYVDSLKAGDEINGYRFLGWESTDVDLSEGIFSMPNKDVTIVGKFERIGYSVSYKFQGSVVPANADSLLPVTKTYYPGDKVTKASAPTATGYRFLDWYTSDTFTMPSEDVVIYGEWMIDNGKFIPTIKKQVVNSKDYYSEGEKVDFKITVTNTANYAIRDVMLQEDNSVFVEGNGYTILSDKFVKIANIPANSSIDVYAQYVVGNDTFKTVTNVVTLTGALADGGYYLDTTKDYKAKASFNVANISLKINKVDKNNNKLSGSEFELYSDSSLNNLVSKGMSYTRLNPNKTYYLKEIKAPDGYVLIDKPIAVSIDGKGNVTVSGYTVTTDNGITTVNITNYKPGILEGGPNTYDAIVLYTIIFIVSLGVIGLVVYYIEKQNKNKKENKK